MGDRLPGAQQFLARGFSLLTADYRGFGPGSNVEAVNRLRNIAFNFQWAWSSGTVAGKAAGEKAVAEVPEAS
jgi:hypothetical protein